MSNYKQASKLQLRFQTNRGNLSVEQLWSLSLTDLASAIKAVKKVELKTEVYVRRERFYGEVKRSFYIGEKKESDIKANYENGILTISFPKEEIPKKEIPNITIK